MRLTPTFSRTIAARAAKRRLSACQRAQRAAIIETIAGCAAGLLLAAAILTALLSAHLPGYY